jgi:hypothetical protein
VTLPVLVWLVLATVWGSTWLFIKIGLADLPPLTFTGIRFVVASTPLVLGLWISGFFKGPIRAISGRDWRLMIWTGLLTFTVNYAAAPLVTACGGGVRSRPIAPDAGHAGTLKSNWSELHPKSHRGNRRKDKQSFPSDSNGTLVPETNRLAAHGKSERRDRSKGQVHHRDSQGRPTPPRAAKEVPGTEVEPGRTRASDAVLGAIDEPPDGSYLVNGRERHPGLALERAEEGPTPGGL